MILNLLWFPDGCRNPDHNTQTEQGTILTVIREENEVILLSHELKKEKKEFGKWTKSRIKKIQVFCTKAAFFCHFYIFQSHPVDWIRPSAGPVLAQETHVWDESIQDFIF